MADIVRIVDMSATRRRGRTISRNQFLKPSFIGLFDFLRMIGLVGSHLSISPSDFLVRWFPPKTRAAAAGHPRPPEHHQ